jgi:hypothetical protein
MLVGVERNDGTTAILPPELQKTCIIGQEKFNEAMAKHLNKWISNSPVECSACATYRAFLLLTLFYPRLHSTCGLIA